MLAAACSSPSATTNPDAGIPDGGEPFALDALAGRDTLVFFGYTHCPDICPITLGVIAQAR